jgi:hypothetical protein
LANISILEIHAGTSCWVDDGGLHVCVLDEVLSVSPRSSAVGFHLFCTFITNLLSC